MKYTIKQINANDWLNYKNIRLETLQKEPQAFSSTYKETLKYSDSKWKQVLSDKNTRFLIAFHKNIAIGIGRISFNETEEPIEVAVLGSLYVNIKYRKYGIGKELVKQLIKLAEKQEGIESVKLYVKNKQLAAINLYSSLGFVKTEIEQDEIVMRKSINT